MMKILHLDDHVLFTEGLKAILSNQYGYQVSCANTIEQALTALEQESGFELILVDLSMPGLDGIAFIDSLIERQIFVPFVVLSASEDLWAIRHAMDKGSAGFIPKTYSSEVIIDIIQSVMAGDVYLPQSVQEGLVNLPEQEPCDALEKLMVRYRISKRQMDVLKYMQQGYSTEEIARVLNRSVNTVKSHSKALFAAFEVNNRLECVRYAERVGLLQSHV